MVRGSCSERIMTDNEHIYIDARMRRECHDAETYSKMRKKKKRLDCQNQELRTPCFVIVSRDPAPKKPRDAFLFP